MIMAKFTVNCQVQNRLQLLEVEVEVRWGEANVFRFVCTSAARDNNNHWNGKSFSIRRRNTRRMRDVSTSCFVLSTAVVALNGSTIKQRVCGLSSSPTFGSAWLSVCLSVLASDCIHISRGNATPPTQSSAGIEAEQSCHTSCTATV